MSQFVLLKALEVQNANAVSGFTWGFPAITHFLGFVHNLSLKLAAGKRYNDISLDGCAVISHKHHVHTYQASRDLEFLQSKNPPYLHGTSPAKSGEAPSIIEEGKMNMTVSLLIECKGNIGNREQSFLEWLNKTCQRMRLAGGSIINIGNIKLCIVREQKELKHLTRTLLPGFVLLDRADYLFENYHRQQKVEPGVELLDTWLDFFRLKQVARPQSNLIKEHLLTLLQEQPDDERINQLFDCWHSHLDTPFNVNQIPEQLSCYFESLPENKQNKKLLKQWLQYCQPTNKTPADWEYVKRAFDGYLVPIMTGYKAISKDMKSEEVANTRDHKTRVCFVEAAHSIGEWCGVHKIRTIEDLRDTLWRYSYKPNWYLCKQGGELQIPLAISADEEF